MRLTVSSLVLGLSVAVMPVVALASYDATQPNMAQVAVFVNGQADGATVDAVANLTAGALGDIYVDFVDYSYDDPILGRVSIGRGSGFSSFAVAWDTSSLAEGTYVVHALPNGDASTGLDAVATVVVSHTAPEDATPPVVTLTSPANGSTVRGVMNITANASDNVAVSAVEFYVDGANIGTDTSAPYSFTYDTQYYPVSQHEVKAVAIDPTGNRSSSAVTVTFDNTPIVVVPPPDTTAPSTAITSPDNDSTVAKKSTAIIKASATDNVGVTKVEFYVNGALTCTSTQSPYSCSFATGTQPGKVFKLSTLAYDAAGNKGASVVVSVTSR